MSTNLEAENTNRTHLDRRWCYTLESGGYLQHRASHPGREGDYHTAVSGFEFLLHTSCCIVSMESTEKIFHPLAAIKKKKHGRFSTSFVLTVIFTFLKDQIYAFGCQVTVKKNEVFSVEITISGTKCYKFSAFIQKNKNPNSSPQKECRT